VVIFAPVINNHSISLISTFDQDLYMKLKLHSLPILQFIVFLMITNFAAGQQTGCKVLMPAISGTYSGECKKGLANGNGVAQGTDHYEGHFSKGLPDGQGTYTWQNGSFFQGQWEKGLKNGIGKMVYKSLAGDSIVTGYWEKDNYKGKKLIPSYKITRNQGVARYVFRKVGDGNDLDIKIFLGSQFNTNVEDFSLAYDSGDEFERGSSYGIQNIRFPLNVKITYRTWNQFHTSQSNVTLDFELSEPGKWELTLVN
jgi:hypothetical protein